MEEALQPYVEPEPEKKRWSGRRKITLAILGIALLVALYFLVPVLLAIFVVQPVRVEGSAMSPALNNGDKVFISKRIDRLERGDIVVFYYPRDTTKSFIKRIVGLPGEKIDVDSDGYITINGQVISERYIFPHRNQMAKARWSGVPTEWKQLDDHSYFILGDNRDASNDSRNYGPVSRDLIYGKYLMRYSAAGE